MGLYILLVALLLLAIALAIANYAPSYFKSKYNKISSYVLDTDYTAGDFAIDVVSKSKYTNIRLGKIEGDINNCCFVPRTNTIYLDEETIQSNSVASFAVFAHEYGHAIQHNSGDKRYKLLMMLVKFSNYFGRLAFPLLLIGAILMLVNIQPNWIGYSVAIAGGVIFLITFLARLITISIEYQASDIGVKVMEKEGIFNKKTLKLAKKLLRSAGLTYVGSFFSSILAWTFLVPKYKF